MEYVMYLQNVTNNPAFIAECQRAALKMATASAKGQFQSWREAAAASTNGRRIAQLLRKETTTDPFISQAVTNITISNSQLIKTVPSSIAKNLSASIQKQKMAGARPEEMINGIMRQAKHLSVSQARRIARTEAQKASTTLREARALKYGRPFYVWYTSKDERVRSTHERMHGVVCRWDDAPNPEALFGSKYNYGAYHAGNIFNCRCIPLSVISISDLSFPVRCHKNGQIKTCGSKKAFMVFYGIDSDE